MATCNSCGTNHKPGECPMQPGAGGKDKKKKKVEKHAHQWKWKRRGGGKLGGYYDEYECTFPGCTATKDEPV
jgi:hypothetical protein